MNRFTNAIKNQKILRFSGLFDSLDLKETSLIHNVKKNYTTKTKEELRSKVEKHNMKTITMVSIKLKIYRDSLTITVNLSGKNMIQTTF